MHGYIRWICGWAEGGIADAIKCVVRVDFQFDLYHLQCCKGGVCIPCAEFGEYQVEKVGHNRIICEGHLYKKIRI
jgi:hypothetical protein